MCGITGILNINKKKINPRILESFNNTLIHRGPDGGGIYINDDCFLGLGHRRLSILDLSENGKQPMSYLNDRYWITFNGEIYNFIELREELRSFGYNFKSDCDTEVIMAAYDLWGSACLDKFNGMWAFAIWDTKKQKLFLSRDRFGIKPLYYIYQPNNFFVFSSETISFKSLDFFDRIFDEKKISTTLENSFILEGRGETIFKDIQQLKPGCWLELALPGNLIEKKWWNTSDHLLDIDTNYTRQINEFRELFEDSCRLRLRSDVSMATALSGGVDSSAVYCMLYNLMKCNKGDKRMTNDWQKAFVAIFPDSDINEIDYAKKVVDFVGGELVCVNVNNVSLVEDLVRSTINFDSIYLSPILVAGNVYKSMRAQGLKISLDGHGVDEMLYGYGDMVISAYYCALMDKNKLLADDLLNIFLNMRLPNEIDSLKNDIIKNSSSINLLARKIAIKHPQIKSIYNQLIKNKKDQWLRYPTFSNFNFYLNKSFNRDLISNIAYNIFHETTLPTILRNFDRASMQNGIEVRMPFMDWRLVSYVFSLPLSSKLGNGYTKRILRDSMMGIMPNDIRNRKTKIGLNAPLEKWFNEFLGEYISEVVNSQNFLNSNIWRGNVIRDFAQNKINNKSWTDRDAIKFWPYLNAYILINHNK